MLDLAGIVSTALAALPEGVAGVCALTRVTKGEVDAATDARASNAPVTMAGLTCVCAAPKPTRVLPPGLTPETALLVSIPAAQCVLFAPAFGDVLALNGRTAPVLEVDTVDPSGAAPALYTVLVKRPA